MKSRKKILIALVPLAFIVVSLIVFVNSFYARILPLYAFGASGVPLGEKIDCAFETQERVKNKFENPPDFDRDSINGLKEFWHYSFFKECLYNAGYEFDGEAVPESQITDSVYINDFIGFSFSVPSDTTIKIDNEIDVEFDNRLFESVLIAPNFDVEIHAYSMQEQNLLQDVFVDTPRLSGTNTDPIEKELIPDKNAFYIRQKEIQGFVFVDEEKIIHVYSKSFATDDLEKIVTSFSFK